MWIDIEIETEGDLSICLGKLMCITEVLLTQWTKNKLINWDISGEIINDEYK